jgi:S-phase kinase-associated protein 1
MAAPIAETIVEPIDNFEVPIVGYDEVQFTVSMSGAKQSGTLRHLIIDLAYDRAAKAPIPVLIPDVSTAALRVALDFCEKAARTTEDPANFTVADPSDRTKVARIPDWMATLIKPFADNYKMLADIVTYADYMDIQDLVQLASHSIACMIKGKSTEEMREIMGITEETEGKNFGFNEEQLTKEIPDEKEFIRRLDADRESRTAQVAK